MEKFQIWINSFDYSKLVFDYHFNILALFLLFSDIYPFLERMCLDGTRRQAKFAVSAVAALSSEQSVFLILYEVHFFCVDAGSGNKFFTLVDENIYCVAWTIKTQFLVSFLLQKQILFICLLWTSPNKANLFCRKRFGLKFFSNLFPKSWNYESKIG